MKIKIATMVAVTVIAAASPAHVEPKVVRNDGLCEGRTILVYIPGDGFRATLNIARGNELFVFPTQGVNEATACKVVGAEPNCLQSSIPHRPN